MNQNFVGQPNAEDIRALEGLRRGLVPMIAAMDRLKRDMDFKMSQGGAVDWPQIQRTTAAVNSHITSLNIFINGGRKHAPETRKTDAGKVLKNRQGGDETRYTDTTIPSQADTIRNLHPFPIAPFPNTNEHLAGLAQTLLRKRLEPTEEKWIEERLSKALEFASVPPEWGIEPKKTNDKEATKETDDEIDGDPTRLLNRYSKRTKGTLTEEQLVQRWNTAHTWFFNPPQTSFDEEEYASGEEGDEEDDDEGQEFEDAMNTPAPDASAAQSAAQEEPAKPAAPPPPVVMVQEAEPPVHKPVPGMPVLELGLIQRFMATGQL
ncbi:mediator of RNA polymerase II transcription subunit 8 [Ascochyta lentis]